MTTVSSKMELKNVKVGIEDANGPMVSAVVKPMVCSANGLMSILPTIAAALALLH